MRCTVSCRIESTSEEGHTGLKLQGAGWPLIGALVLEGATYGLDKQRLPEAFEMALYGFRV